jgi:hypothetical protein
MFSVLVFPLPRKLDGNGFRFPKPIGKVLRHMAQASANAALVSRDASEGYLLLEGGTWSRDDVPGAEIHGPFDTCSEARVFVETRVTRWREAGRVAKEKH